MKKILLVIFFLQYLVSLNAQSIKVNSAGSSETNYEAEQLLMNVLLDGGSCSAVTNFQLKDNPERPFPNGQRSWGFFEKGSSNFPFERGIVLTSGYAVDAEGPDSGIVSQGTYSWTGDFDATQLANAPTNNATVFEFDFIPDGNFISFNYIFASEEYPQYACDQNYNDVFGFIISGPGITNDPGLSGKNIALLPSGEPVTINNVNGEGCGDASFYVGGPFQDIEYGGRTVPLTAESVVIPGETYHIRLLVADAGDNSYDSAVFLEGGSFSLGSTLVDGNGVSLGDSVTVCGADEYTVYLSVEDENVDIKWYVNGDLVPGENGLSLTVNFSCHVRVEVADGDCTSSDEVEIIFGDLPTNGEVFTLEAVDTDGDGFATFNLTDVQPMVVDNPEDMAFSYYEQEEDAETEDNPILNPVAYVAADNTVVYCRVENEDGCYKVVRILLKVLDDCINPEAACPGPEFGLNIPFQGDGTIPVSAPPGPNYDCLYNQPYPRFYYFKIAQSGNLEFDMNQYTEPDEQGEAIDVDFIVWGPFEEVPCDYEDLQQVVDCSYSASPFEHISIPNGIQGEYYIMMVTNYAGSYGKFGYVNLVFDEENSTGSFDCSIITGAKEYFECDNDGDGQVQFDLASIASDIAEGDDTLSITFYSNEEDATEDTGMNTIPTAPYTVTTATSPEVIFAQIKNVVDEVEKVIKVTLTIYPGIEGAFDNYAFFCDTSGDGTAVIDLTDIQIMEGDTSGYSIRYYDNEDSAIAGDASFIPNPTSYTASSGNIYVRIEDENGCFKIVVITLEISGLEVDLGEDFSMCEGEFTLTASGDFEGFTGVTYSWYAGGDLIYSGEENTLVINSPGTYTVVVETEEGCTGTDTVVVSQGDAAIITDIHVGPDYIIVTAEGGATPYKYSMTGVVWQDSNQFNYLQPGIHTVYVKTAEGCITAEQFAIFDIPTMFTPNGDGINDTWNIQGLEIYPGTDVVIYDRYGRLIYEAELNSHVIWDGMMSNGKKAPTQDYWYIINVTDGRKFTGHVTLKSRGEKY